MPGQFINTGTNPGGKLSLINNSNLGNLALSAATFPGYYTWNLYSNKSSYNPTTICNNSATLVTVYTSASSLGVGVILYSDTALTTQYLISNPGGSGGCIGLGTPGSTVWAASGAPPTGQIQGTVGTC